MNILIVGCGDTGSRLAILLDRLGHDISVVDRNIESMAALGEDFGGLFTVGVPIDQDVLRHAGIQGCDAVISATKDDNINLMVSQLAQDIFHVNHVISRVSDPQREEVFSSFGLSTICPTNLTVDSMVSMIAGNKSIGDVHIGSSKIIMQQMQPEDRYIGKDVSTIPLPAGTSLVGVLGENGKVKLHNHSLAMDLLPGDMIVYAKVVGEGVI